MPGGVLSLKDGERPATVDVVTVLVLQGDLIVHHHLWMADMSSFRVSGLADPGVMARRLGAVAAVSHGTPPPVLRPALIDEQPAAASIVPTLLDPPCPGAGHEFSRGDRDRCAKIEFIWMRAVPAEFAGSPFQQSGWPVMQKSIERLDVVGSGTDISDLCHQEFVDRLAQRYGASICGLGPLEVPSPFRREFSRIVGNAHAVLIKPIQECRGRRKPLLGGLPQAPGNRVDKADGQILLRDRGRLSLFQDLRGTQARSPNSNLIRGFTPMKLPSASFLLIAAFGAIYLIWGSTYLALALALQSLPPFLLMAARCMVGGLILFVVAAASGAKAPSRKSLLYGIVCGLLFFVGCHGILANVQQRVPTGLAAVMLATIPLWIAALQTGLGRPNRPSPLALSFLAPGVVGVALIAWEEGAGGIGAVHLIDIFLLLGASLSWSIGTVVSEQSPTSSSPLVMSVIELWAGAAALAVVGAANGEVSLVHPYSITGWSIAGWAYLTVAGTVIAFAAYIWLLRKVTPTLVATYTFVNPIIAVLLGWAFLGEVPSMWMATGALLVILSVSGLLFTGSARPSRRSNKARAELAVD